ncbi:MAG: hypothetical protein M5U26_27430 [Planctomycetota bacterium]|nr:hypothetical protein [Planctomycetota bacterium]
MGQVDRDGLASTDTLTGYHLDISLSGLRPEVRIEIAKRWLDSAEQWINFYKDDLEQATKFGITNLTSHQESLHQAELEYARRRQKFREILRDALNDFAQSEDKRVRDEYERIRCKKVCECMEDALLLFFEANRARRNDPEWNNVLQEFLTAGGDKIRNDFIVAVALTVVSAGVLAFAKAPVVLESTIAVGSTVTRTALLGHKAALAAEALEIGLGGLKIYNMQDLTRTISSVEDLGTLDTGVINKLNGIKPGLGDRYNAYWRKSIHGGVFNLKQLRERLRDCDNSPSRLLGDDRRSEIIRNLTEAEQSELRDLRKEYGCDR